MIMTSTSSVPAFKELSQRVLLANKDHQYALKVYTERLEAELETVDKLLAAVELPDDEFDVDVGGSIVIPDAMKAVGPIPNEITLEDGPFAQDTAKRRRYMKSTIIHPMKGAELDALSDAVQSENHRLFALEAQRRGQQPFVGLDDHPPGFFELNKTGLNWERIATKVSAAGVNYVQRTAQECEIRWLGDRHPDFDHSQWSEAEITRVRELVGDAKEGEVDWLDIAAKLGTKRTAIDCMRHAITRQAHVWTPEADERLLEAVEVYGTESWLQVARQVSEDATASQCQNRYIRSLDPNIRRGPWTSDEDAQLRQAVEVFGRQWMEVCVWVPGRNNEQCRERWQEALNTGSKGKWTEEEDQALLDAYNRCGEGKWKDISQIVGRADSTCRHRYTTLIKRRARVDAGTSHSPATASPAPSRPGEQESTLSETGTRASSTRGTRSQAQVVPMGDGILEANPATETTERHKPKPRPRAKRAAAQTKAACAEVEDANEILGDDEGGHSSISPVILKANAKASRGRRKTQSSSKVPVDDRDTVMLANAEEPNLLEAVESGGVFLPPKRGRGRPRKHPKTTDRGEQATQARHTNQDVAMQSAGLDTGRDAQEVTTIPQKRGRGRPRKQPICDDVREDGDHAEPPANKKRRVNTVERAQVDMQHSINHDVTISQATASGETILKDTTSATIGDGLPSSRDGLVSQPERTGPDAQGMPAVNLELDVQHAGSRVRGRLRSKAGSPQEPTRRSGRHRAADH